MPGTAVAPAEVGVLALQGDFDAHARALARIGATAREVRTVRALGSVSSHVLPGGESTTLLRLIREEGFDRALPEFAERGGAILGTCAGAILLARSVRSPAQWSLGMLDIEIERNAYGRQADSFETTLTEVAPALADPPASAAPLPAVFIRAPRIRSVGPGVEVLASRRGEPVLVRSGRILAATFHPELTADGRVHRLFLEARARPAPPAPAAIIPS